MTTASNMGYDANYSIESNWMGVRYGAVLLAALVNDDWNANDKVKSRLLPFEWDANKRLGEHIAVNINPNGWNTESLSYFSYNWTFVAPALNAWQNRIGAARYSIEQNVPNVVNSLWAYSTATVAIPGINSKVMQPDFSDDDPMSSYFLYPIGLKLLPETQKPALLWMLNYLSGPDTWANDAEQLFTTFFGLLKRFNLKIRPNPVGSFISMTIRHGAFSQPLSGRKRYCGWIYRYCQTGARPSGIRQPGLSHTWARQHLGSWRWPHRTSGRSYLPVPGCRHCQSFRQKWCVGQSYRNPVRNRWFR